MEKVIVNSDLYFDCLNKDPNLSFSVVSGKEVFLFLKDINNVNSIDIDVRNDSILRLSIFSKNPIDLLKITANVAKNSKIICYFADFSVEKNHLEASINLNDEDAKCEWHLASLSSQKDDKNISVSIYHNSPRTFGKIDNYGVCKDHSKLVFSGVSHILKGCHQSASHQNAKIVVFDDNCLAIAKPILRIDENDIEASHAAVVGKVSDEHIFYLTSRGLSVDEAKLLITLGYLKPILKGFDQSVSNEIDSVIERRL
ncbi:MAG: SufD family Fe-S cluster assembly protein [Bacilli bacterium]|nr:SufD family Fe-S cluster assembly protein [Bacilli bacterium]